MNAKPIAAGKSSFGLVDTRKLFMKLALEPGCVFLDVACGAGAYSIAASEKIGESGAIHAVDFWKEGIHSLQSQICERQINNIHASVADVSKPESYVMVSIKPETPLTFTGTNDPAAFVRLKSIGLPKERCTEFSEEICGFIEQQLEVPKARVFIEFKDLERALFGWDAKTF